jgi:SAM-dependent methyltransferase
MSAKRQAEAHPEQEAQEAPIPTYLDARGTFAAAFLSGKGLEIGPLHCPLPLPRGVEVSYVDRMPVERLREEYPELADWNLAPVDIVDDGEKLLNVPDESQDFIIANHFLEHTEDPIGTIETHLSKLRQGGVLFYAVPDKRHTFDYRRPVTPVEHIVADYEEGPERSRREHFDEWARLVPDQESPAAAGGEKAAPEEWAQKRARELEAEAYSIHMHVWTQAEFLDLVLDIRRRLGEAFDIEAAARQGIEFMVVIRKRGPLPAPARSGRRPSAAPKPRLLSRVRAKLARIAKRLRG